jgi:hypothetical protein
MNDPTKADPPNSRRGIFDEADIGSGEKTPGQRETEEMIREIPPLPHPNRQSGEDQQPRNEGDKGNGAKPEPGNRQASGA